MYGGSCTLFHLSLPFLSGVYFEKVLKSSDTSLWVRNIQLYLSGIVVTLVGVYMSDGVNVMEKGFFYGYTRYVWFVICKYPIAFYLQFYFFLLQAGARGVGDQLGEHMGQRHH